MRFQVWVLTAAGLLASLACAQQDEPQRPGIAAQDGGVREVMESIVVPPIPNAPFSATLATEWARPTQDGGTITLVNQRQIARDNVGRVYEQRWALVPKGGQVKSILTWIQIADPTERTVYNCNVIREVCHLLVYQPESDLAAAHPVEARSFHNARESVEVENLGTKTVDGMDTAGTRVTTTLAPGTMGNDKPVTRTIETWRSDQLALNLISVRSAPLTGTQTFTITELDPNPPDPQLFEPPDGFKVVDERTTAPPTH
ncbi:MAG TPA: hypothetical protein VIY53_09215 [Acidobacteriaceae bacterium]